MSDKMLKNYVSEIDLFLERFDKDHPNPSPSQQKEIHKYQRIYLMRDTTEERPDVKTIWDGF